MQTNTDARSRDHFIGIFIIALAVLAYQVLLTRLFSVTLYYHFAFAGISLVMLGLTVGAERVYLHAARFSRERLPQEFARAALGFSLSSVALVIWFLYAPLIIPENQVMIVLAMSLVMFVIPFIYSGICVTLILTKSDAPVGRLYAADLVGAALGCVGVVFLLFRLDPVSIVFALASLTAYAAWRMARGHDAKLARSASILAALWMVAATSQAALYVTDYEHLRVIWAKSKMQENLLFERWNVFSRVRVIPHENSPAFGWGFGRKQPGPIEQKYLDIDADAGTIISRFDGNVKPLAFLSNDVINMGYHIRPVKDVAVIGVGGGRDIMSALFFGVRKVTGIELNPSIFEALTVKFADFTGHFYQRPDVTLVNAEARSWLNQHSAERFDLVQISLIDTWAATAAGGLTLSENKLYTADAWEEFMGDLTPDGMLVVSRWFDPDTHKGEFYRLLSLAVKTLEHKGVPANEVRSHIFAFNSAGIITVAVSNSPYTAAEIAHVRQVVKQENFKLILSPDYAMDDISRVIASGKADEAFYKTLPIDVTAPTDNRPFFFYMTRFGDLLRGEGLQGNINLTNNLAVAIVGFLLIGMFFCLVIFVAQPLVALSRRVPVKPIVPYLGYFGAIGLGFMLIEISQMQRLMVFLGHPVFGLSVVLFTLLLFGGLGSFTVTAQSTGRLWLRPLILCLVLATLGLATPALTEQLKVYSVAVRVVTSVLLLAPAGFCMGMMFPLGMILSRKFHDLQPWFWGVNGAASVFASVLGMAISMEYGIAQAYWCGVACYAACLIFVLWKKEAP